MPRLDATERSILPVMMMNTIGSIIKPNSMKSAEVRLSFGHSRNKGQPLLITIAITTSATNIHSQRWKRARKDFRGRFC